MGVDSAALPQLPRTKLCAMWNADTFSRCSTVMSSPSRSDVTTSCNAAKNGVYRSTWATARTRPVSAATAASSTASASVAAIGFSSSTS